LAPLTLQEAYQHIVYTSAQSPMVIGLEPLLLEEPVLKLRVYLGASLFVDVFYNAETGKTSFALIKDGQRIFGADNPRGWHLHPFGSPERHCPCDATSFASPGNSVPPSAWLACGSSRISARTLLTCWHRYTIGSPKV
jgi:hypothetical protein